jgi:hypothetical protein
VLEPALRNQMIVGPMNVQELRAAVTQPARDAGLSVEAGLAEAMLDDLDAVDSPERDGLTTYDPGKLPLLAHALRETWARREGGQLTVAAYHEAGGIKRALAKKADDIFDAFDEDTQRVARQLLEHLVSVRADAQDTRRLLTRDTLLAELAPGDAQTGRQVLDQLERERLVTADRDTVQITHEALLRYWPRLAGWLEEHRVWIPVHQRLTERAHEWDDKQRHPDMLLHGAQLSALHEHLDDVRRASLGALESSFVRHSSRRQTRSTRLRTLVRTVLVIALVIAGGFAIVAQTNSSAARHQQAIARSRALAARADAVRATNPQVSLLLSLEAYRIEPTEQAVSSLLSTQPGYFTKRLSSPSGPVNAVAWSPDGARLASAGQDGAVTVWDVAGQKAMATLKGQSPFYAVAIHPRGRLAAAAERNGTTVVWNLATA